MDTLTDKPRYTPEEERFNMITHIIGAGLGVVVLIACLIIPAFNRNVIGVVSGAIYGLSVILLFTMSSIYHGLPPGKTKRLFRTLDHCTIFTLIAGTYTPMMLNQFRMAYPLDAWLIFLTLWGLTILGIILNVMDGKRFWRISIICYIGMGWIGVFRFGRLISVLGVPFFVLLLLGGVLYTVGVLFYVMGRRKKYMHSVFHLFVVAASVLHSVGITAFVLV